MCLKEREWMCVCVGNLCLWQVSPPKRSAKQRYRMPIVVASVIARSSLMQACAALIRKEDSTWLERRIGGT